MASTVAGAGDSGSGGAATADEELGEFDRRVVASRDVSAIFTVMAYNFFYAPLGRSVQAPRDAGQCGACFRQRAATGGCHVRQWSSRGDAHPSGGAGGQDGIEEGEIA